MARGKKKTIDIKLMIGILFLLILLIGASYAYFTVEVNSTDYNKTVVTGSTEGVAVASIQNPTTKLNLNVDGAAMSLNNLGTIYADDENNYVKTKSEGFHDIGIITLTNPKKDDNIYKCTANVTITINNSANSILSFLQEGDLKVFIRWGTHHQVIDLSTLKETGETIIPISLDIVGNNSKSIETYIELTNKESDQSYISGKDINIDIDTTDLKCELTGERAVYLVGTGWSNGLGVKIGHETDIKNIYFVNYIDTELAIETWDLTNTNTRDKYYSPAGSIMGWLEEIPKESEEEQFYNLYIGSNDKIYATSMQCFFANLKSAEHIQFDNFYTDVVTSMNRAFMWLINLKSLDLSTFDTSNVTTMEEMFRFDCNVFGCLLNNLNLSTFNTKNVTTMSKMFSGMNLVTELDLSNFNTTNVKYMNEMFINMSSLTELVVNSFYTGKVTSIYSMFDGDKNISQLDVSNFDTSKVTSMSYMFCNMSSLQELDLSNFNTENVTNMASMFRGMRSLAELDTSNFDTHNVTDMRSMFQSMSSLEYLDLRNAEFGEETECYLMFSGVKNGIAIIVKNEENKDWIEDRLQEANITGNVLLPNEIGENQY